MKAPTVIAGFVAVILWTLIIPVFFRVPPREYEVELRDGRTVVCLQSRTVGAAFSCDWANAHVAKVDDGAVVGSTRK